MPRFHREAATKAQEKNKKLFQEMRNSEHLAGKRNAESDSEDEVFRCRKTTRRKGSLESDDETVAELESDDETVEAVPRTEDEPEDPFKQIPREYTCAVSNKVMVYPVVDSSGTSYELGASASEPFFPNKSLRTAIERYVESLGPVMRAKLTEYRAEKMEQFFVNGFVRQAAELGHGKAARAFEIEEFEAAYLSGAALEGVNDKYAARACYKKLSDKGFSKAQYQLGRMVMNGLGGESDVVEGVRLIELASLDGHEAANECIRSLKAFTTQFRSSVR